MPAETTAATPTTSLTAATTNHELPWWATAVIYQVYIRSFADSDGDGIGDLDGIRSRIPYLRALGVDDLFDDVFAIEHTRFRPKPEAHGFLRLMHAHRLVASRRIMVEDSLENLRTARRLGMKTVWVTESNHAPAWVDVSVRHLFRLPRLLHRL